VRLIARVLSGAIAGVGATVIMDAVGTLFWERAMSEADRKKEREIESKFPLTVLGERIASRLALEPVQEVGEQLSTLMHWSIGAGCGALHGLVERRVPMQRAWLGQPIAMSMLAVDEFGFPAANLCPPPGAFPYQTHARAFVAHVAYGVALALIYEGAKAYGGA
jgi:hypothetical protein